MDAAEIEEDGDGEHIEAIPIVVLYTWGGRS
jgi:hypothetical protein